MNKEEFNLKIGQFIRMERQKINFSIRELERKSGVSKSVISKLEGATIPFEELNPKIHTLSEILKCFDKNFIDLFFYVYFKESQSNEKNIKSLLNYLSRKKKLKIN